MQSAKFQMNLKVGMFVVLGVIALCGGIIFLGGNDSIFESKVKYFIHLPSGDGLLPGAKVMISGVQAGRVESIVLDPSTHDIRATIRVKKEFAVWIRADSVAEAASLGLLGDKYMIINIGSKDALAIAENSEIPFKTAQNFSQMLSKSDQLLVSLNSMAGSLDGILKSFAISNRSENFFKGLAETSQNLSKATTRLNEELDGLRLKQISKNIEKITEKINNGAGTIGALINDPGLYDDVKSLVGSTNRNRIMRNLVRKSIKESEEAQAAAEPKTP